MRNEDWVRPLVIGLLGLLLVQCTPRPENAALARLTPVVRTAPRPRVQAPTRRAQAAAATPQAGETAYLPNATLTPGAILDVTKADICVAGYSQKVRNVPETVKTKAYLAYGITTHQPGAYEVDHLISLELGGSNSLKNLWPESYQGVWNAHIKDRLENKLHALVCAGQLDLPTAQHEIATNWIAAYQQYLGQ
jgi:hypothetical protein